MTVTEALRTDRLVLRAWRESDLAPFAAMNADPEVMRLLPRVLDRAESDAWVRRIEGDFARHGFGLWAVEVPGLADFIGYVGLSIPRFTAHFTPCVEVGWRLARAHWGRGYATEAAAAALEVGFTRCALEEIVSFTALPNVRSIAVMEGIGMIRDPADDFDHPSLATDSPLRRHVLYRLGRAQWQARDRTIG